MSKLVVMVPADRRMCGRGALFGHDGRMLLGPFRVLATSNARLAREHGNPSRDPLRPFGHTPTGSYLVAGSLPPGTSHPRRPRRFGSTGALVLAPHAGAAAEAAASGRRQLYLHGGPPDRHGRLRPTYGGLRLSDRTLTALLAAINRAFASGDTLSTVEVIDVPAPPRSKRKSADRIGEGRPFLAAAERRRGGIGPVQALILLGGAGLLGSKGGAGPDDPTRRRLLAGALMLLSGVGASACCASDKPSPCEPVACDPVDPWCPPEGTVCAQDVYAGWYDTADGEDTSGGGG